MTEKNRFTAPFTGETVIEEKSKAAGLIRDFISEKLSGDPGAWLDFDHLSLYDSEKYGCPGRQFDCDDTEIMRAVYVLLWAGYFPDLTFDNLGTGKSYRGDTLNTFHTMFGREIKDRPGFYAGLECYDPDDSLREKIRLFRSRSSRLGNYTVLPNLSVNGDTLNTWRGCSHLRDYFDRFLAQVQASLTGKDCDSELQALMDENAFFFKHFQGDEGFARFAEISLFYDYFSKDEQKYPLIAEIFKMNYHWFRPNDRESYFEAAHIYLEKAEEIITNRTKNMLSHIILTPGIC